MSALRGLFGGAFQILHGLAATLLLLVALFGGLYVYQNHWSEWAELPVIREITGNYRLGLAAIGGLSEQTVQQFLTLEESSGAAKKVRHRLPGQIAVSWSAETILDKLQFSKAKTRQARYFTDYIDRHAADAMRDMLFSKVPASIKLAQALLESRAGRSDLAKATNNHFGIKARPGRSAREKIRAGRIEKLYDREFLPVAPAVGAFRFHDDHTYDRFETYHNVADSYERHSQLLSRKCTPGRIGCYSWIWEAFPPGKHYDIRQAARQYLPASGIAPEQFYGGETYVPYYAACAAGLKMAGYATSPTYHKKITYLIETYELWRFDLDLLQQLEDHPELFNH